MSVSSEHWSVVSLGMSCQSSHQLRLHLAGATINGQTFRIDSQYFDYLVTPIWTLLRVLDGPFPELSGPADIEEALLQPLWTEQGLFFAHNFRTGALTEEINIHNNGPIDVAATYPHNAAKIAYLRQKFLSLDNTPRSLVFIVSNAQFNLASYCGHSSRYHGTFGLNRTLVATCADTLRQRYGKRFARLIIVEGGDLHSGDWNVPHVSRYNAEHRLGPPGSEWEGDHALWSTLLHTELTAIIDA